MRDTYFCPICHATIDGKIEFAKHRETHNSAPVVTVPTVIDNDNKDLVKTEENTAEVKNKYTLEQLKEMNSKRLRDTAKNEFGVEEINGEKLYRLENAVIENYLFNHEKNKGE